MSDKNSGDEFVHLARSFVDWCERPHTDETDEDFVLEARRLLATIYTSGLELIAVPFVDSPDPLEPTAAQLDSVSRNLLRLPFRHYWMSNTPSDMTEGNDRGVGDLLDDFLDIYRDLRAGIATFDAGYSQAALYHWHQLFFHWGQHSVDAMTALHSYDPKSSDTI